MRGLSTPIYGLDESAPDAVKRWTFAPGVQGGQAVPVLARIGLTFALPEPLRLSVATDVPPDFLQYAVAIDVVGLEAPLVRERVEAKYTAKAMMARIEGTVDVDVVIGLEGSVLRARGEIT